MPQKFVSLVTFKPIRVRNWKIRASYTDMGSFMMLIQSKLVPENIFIKFFGSEEQAVSFIDFLRENDFWTPEITED